MVLSIVTEDFTVTGEPKMGILFEPTKIGRMEIRNRPAPWHRPMVSGYGLSGLDFLQPDGKEKDFGE
jgi:hypothetical protein